MSISRQAQPLCEAVLLRHHGESFKFCAMADCVLSCIYTACIIELELGCACLKGALCMQIAMVAAWDANEASAQGGTPSTAAACASAAQQMLLHLMTDPRHGIAPPVKCGAVSSAVADQPGALSGQPQTPLM